MICGCQVRVTFEIEVAWTLDEFQAATTPLANSSLNLCSSWLSLWKIPLL